jgi:hypothetical protein
MWIIFVFISWLMVLEVVLANTKRKRGKVERKVETSIMVTPLSRPR